MERKTIEQLLMDECKYGYHEFTDSFTSVHRLHFIKAMQAYADQEREIAVREAIEFVIKNAKYKRFNDNERGTSGMRLDEEYTLSLEQQILTKLRKEREA